MKNNFSTRRYFLMFCIGLVLFSVHSSYGQNSDQLLEFKLKTDRPIYHKGEKIPLEVLINNLSSKEVILFWCNDHISVGFGEGGFGTIALIDVCLALNPKVETLYIKPQKFIEKEIILDTSSWKGGDYFLRLQYRYPNTILDFEMTPDQVIFEHDQNSLQIFNIKIIEPNKEVPGN